MRCVVPIYPSPRTAIYAGKDGKFELRFFQKEEISVEEQQKLNSYYMNIGLGDSGAGVIREAKADGTKNGQADTRRTILAVVERPGVTLQAARKQAYSKDKCTAQVSRLAQNEIDWIKQIDQKHYKGNINHSKFDFTNILRWLTLADPRI